MRSTFTSTVAVAALGIVSLAGCSSSTDGAKSSSATDPVSSSNGAEPAAPAGTGVYINVVKLTGIAWFDRMDTGVADFAKSAGVDASQTGPASADTAQQVSVIQSAISQKPTVLGIVPLDPGAVENVIQQARDAGIVVVTHEAPSIKGADADIEPFDNAAYGTKMMDALSECMKGEGEYVQFVGSLTSETHMAWANAGYSQQQAQYAGMSRVGEPNESKDNADTSYQMTKQLLQANPELKGFFGDSSQDVPGIGRAIREAGLQDETCVVGTGVPSETKEFLADGSIDGIFLWDPALAGRAMLAAGQIIAGGGTLSNGTDLQVPGYNSLVQSKDNPLTFYGDAPLVITKDNVGDYEF